jgi:tetratricopeptide (TPR) repeat protein
MRRSVKDWSLATVLALSFTTALLYFALPATAGLAGSAHGHIIGVDGKPWADLPIVFVSSTGQEVRVKTDKDGNFVAANLRPDTYTVRVLLPGREGQPYEAKAHIGIGDDVPIDINFQEMINSKPSDEEAKRKDEATKKFKAMQELFNAGVDLLTQAEQVRNSIPKAPLDQRAALKEKVTSLCADAVTKLEAARNSLEAKDPNMAVLWARLGEAYDIGGRDDDAVNAYEQALQLKQDASQYDNLGNILARQGKIEDAGKMYEKSAELDPTNAAHAWLNFAIVLYNHGRSKDAAEQANKSIKLDPKNANAWYVLGASLVGLIEVKKEGDKEVPTVPPGTADALQKAMELDPNGPIGAQAKQMLQELQAIAPGIATTYGTKPRGKR